MVICVDQAGRRDPLNSWGVAGQIHDLVRMPDIVELALPGVHVDRERLYTVGVSMGGQEALLALAFHPEHWAAALCVDGVADLAARYREFALVDRLDVRPLMRAEVGGSPRQAPFAYAVRSPITFTRTLATSGVPLAIWWSAEDQLVINQATTQTGHLYSRILALDPAAPVVQRIGTGGHGLMIRQDPDLAVDFLCPGGEWLRRPSAPARWEYSGWEPSSDAWGYRFSTVGQLEKRWRVAVAGDRMVVRTPTPLTIRVPYSDDRADARAGAGERRAQLRRATPRRAPHRDAQGRLHGAHRPLDRPLVHAERARREPRGDHGEQREPAHARGHETPARAGGGTHLFEGLHVAAAGLQQTTSFDRAAPACRPPLARCRPRRRDAVSRARAVTARIIRLSNH